MMTNNQENIGEIFSIFHDGIIACHRIDGSNLHLEIEISYLARRVSPTFTKFFVSLASYSNIRFMPWQEDPQSKPVVLTEIDAIFKPRLDILQSCVKNGEVEVICNHSMTTQGYCGGDLYFHAESAQVIDEAGNSYSIEDLAALCKSYWEEWASNNPA